MFINKQAAFCHNGVMSSYGEDKKLSDSANFVKKVLEPLGKRIFNDKAIYNFVESIAEESYSKFVLMNKGKVHIMNVSAGEYRDNCWLVIRL